MRTKTSSFILALLLLLSVGQALPVQSHWVGTWAASQQRPEPQNALSKDDLHDATLRQIIHLSLGGSRLRVHLSNRFGTAPFHIASAHVARAQSRDSGTIITASDKALTFSGSADLTIPAGAEYVSDPLVFSARAFSDLAITLSIEEPPAEQTGHPGSRETSFLVHGDSVSAGELPEAKKVDHWYFISGVDVEVAASGARSVVTLGDSITDGHGATTNGNDRWPDVLAERLRSNPRTRDVGVLNHGIGGNRLLLDGLGPNALARFSSDVIAQTGVRYLIVLEGINDIGTLARDHEVPQSEHDALVRHMIGAYEQMIVRAHAHGIKTIGATILPFAGSGYYHPDDTSEHDRQAVNQWIRARGHFDMVVDLDKVTRDPQHPDRLLPAYDSGDHLHPSPAGYRAMGNAFPITLFVMKDK
ncbi:MAG: SGNH/GDSL hydrolase family protein [Acidobacteria bacterium]|nr:SGNH/GDSL hydrolase family protein [Acidobacteriota bacterium]